LDPSWNWRSATTFEEREAISLESSPTIQITWLWKLKELLHFADGSTGMSVYVEYQVRVVCFL
jgi:hypothetical protein